MSLAVDIETVKQDILKPKILDKTEKRSITLQDEVDCFEAVLDLIPEALPQGGIGIAITNDSTVNLDIEVKQLVSPVITPQWTFLKSDGSTPYNPASSGSKNLIVDKGVRAELNATYLYPAPTSDQALPTGTNGVFGTSLPAPNTQSPLFNQANITANATFTQNLTKPKTGLPVVNGYVTLPSGNDVTTDSVSITFSGRSYLGYSVNTVLSPSDILALANKIFATTRARTVSGVTATLTQYTYLVYDASLGDLTNVIMDGAEPILQAFTKLADVTIVNDAGLSMAMRVYRSNQTQAFTNNTLSFS